MTVYILLLVVVALLGWDIVYTRRWLRQSGRAIVKDWSASKPAAAPQSIFVTARLINDLDPDRIPAVLGIIASQLHESDPIHGTRRKPSHVPYPIRDADGNVTGSWMWGYGEP